MTTAQEIKGFTIAELSSFIVSKLIGQIDIPESVVMAIKDNKISGKSFLELTACEMIPVIGEQKAVKEILDSYSGKLLIDSIVFVENWKVKAL